MLPDHDVYLHPTLLRLGRPERGSACPSRLAYLLWKPVARGRPLLGAPGAYVRRHLVGTWERRAASGAWPSSSSRRSPVLSPLWGEAGRGTFDFISGEIWPVGHLWGYPMSAHIRRAHAAGASSGPSAPWRAPQPRRAALRHGRARRCSCRLSTRGRGPRSWWCSAAAIVLAGALRAQTGAPRRCARALAGAGGAARCPAAYYFVLQHTDASWELGRRELLARRSTFTMSWRLALAARAARAAGTARRTAGRRPADLGERILWLWAPFAVALYLFPGTPVRFHAFNGVVDPAGDPGRPRVAPYVARCAARGSTARAGHGRSRGRG